MKLKVKVKLINIMQKFMNQLRIIRNKSENIMHMQAIKVKYHWQKMYPLFQIGVTELYLHSCGQCVCARYLCLHTLPQLNCRQHVHPLSLLLSPSSSPFPFSSMFLSSCPNFPPPLPIPHLLTSIPFLPTPPLLASIPLLPSSPLTSSPPFHSSLHSPLPTSHLTSIPLLPSSPLISSLPLPPSPPSYHSLPFLILQIWPLLCRTSHCRTGPKYK